MDIKETYPVYQQIIEIIGVDNFIKLSEKIGGRYFRWPKLRAHLTTRPKWEIMLQARTEGKTYAEIGQLVGISRVGAYLAVKKMTKAGKYC